MSAARIPAIQDDKVCSQLISRLKQYDCDTYVHCCRVANISTNIGKLLNLPEPKLKQLHYAALLHDIGKTKVPHCILHKTERLESHEWNVIKKHSLYGANILIRCPTKKLNREVVQGVYHHHEYYNGKGYPDGIRGEKIPLYARIIAIADALDAMINPRPYRPQPLPYDEALSELQVHSGTQFDPRIINRIINSVTKISKEER